MQLISSWRVLFLSQMNFGEKVKKYKNSERITEYQGGRWRPYCETPPLETSGPPPSGGIKSGRESALSYFSKQFSFK